MEEIRAQMSTIEDPRAVNIASSLFVFIASSKIH
jgi:hypothetical protein